MTLREHFAARAPSEPQWPFEVAMPTPRPEPDMRGEGQFRWAANAHELAAWDAEHARQRLIQWPWEWADAVIGAAKVTAAVKAKA